MKEFCRRMMKINSNMPYGEDFSPIALLFYLREKGFSEITEYDISEFSTYLYRFYSDNPTAKKRHYHKIINELWHYEPKDLFDYTKVVLNQISDSTELIKVFRDRFVLTTCPKDIEQCKSLLNGIIETIAAKYLGEELKNYSSVITGEEYIGKTSFNKGSRVFYRAMEKLNYCFICDKDSVDELMAVQLEEKDVFDIDNYLIMCKEHAKLFVEGILTIKKNGYPYIDGERLFQHIEIDVLKKIRHNLKG